MKLKALSSFSDVLKLTNFETIMHFFSKMAAIFESVSKNNLHILQSADNSYLMNKILLLYLQKYSFSPQESDESRPTSKA